jgi:hypothetical protein
MSLSRLTFLCHSNLLTSICCIHFDKILCNHRGIIETRCEYHGGFLGNFNWTVAIISRIEFGSWWTKDERNLWRVCHRSYCHGTSSEWQVIEIAWRNIDIARVADPRRMLTCQIIFVMNFVILHFISGSYLILQRNMSFLYLFVVMKSWDVSFKWYFDKIFWSNSNMRLRLINPED